MVKQHSGHLGGFLMLHIKGGRACIHRYLTAADHLGLILVTRGKLRLVGPVIRSYSNQF